MRDEPPLRTIMQQMLIHIEVTVWIDLTGFGAKSLSKIGHNDVNHQEAVDHEYLSV